MKAYKKLGIVGGMGPMATAYFMELITEMTQASCDSEHIVMDIKSIPTIPDRTSYILGASSLSPVPDIITAIRKLTADQAEVIAIPCNTAFYFYEEFKKETTVPILNPISETADYLLAAKKTKAGILATDGTVQTGLFQQELMKRGIEPILPDKDSQTLVMKLIYEDVKAGRPIERETFYRVSDCLFNQGAQTIVLGCTELSMMKRLYNMPAGYLDTLDLLAMRVVRECATVKPEYENLITV